MHTGWQGVEIIPFSHVDVAAPSRHATTTPGHMRHIHSLKMCHELTKPGNQFDTTSSVILGSTSHGRERQAVEVFAWLVEVPTACFRCAVLKESAETASKEHILGSSTCCIVLVDTLQVRPSPHTSANKQPAPKILCKTDKRHLPSDIVLVCLTVEGL